MSFLASLQRIDRRILYLLVAGVVIYALVKPIGLPIVITKETRQSYDFLASLPPGSTVILSLDYDASSIPELQTGALAVGRQLFARDIKVIGVSMWAQGGNLLGLWWNQLQTEFPNKQYGIDFVNLGYKPGGQVFLERTLNSLDQAVAGVDASGAPTTNFPILSTVKTGLDVQAWIDMAGGNPGVNEVVKVIGAQGMPVVAGVNAVSVPENLPLLQAGQIKGLIQGMRGSAEYEKLTNKLGQATSGMDALSLTHVLLVLFIALGNIGYFAAQSIDAASKRR
jgi:hypothetical protein